MLGGADNPNGELLSYIIGADSVTCRMASGHSQSSPGYGDWSGNPVYSAGVFE